MAEERLIAEEEFTRLLERVHRLKMRELFEEPSSYEDELEEQE
jgi:hypothetical protein